jgi:hypothetical protein
MISTNSVVEYKFPPLLQDLRIEDLEPKGDFQERMKAMREKLKNFNEVLKLFVSGLGQEENVSINKISINKISDCIRNLANNSNITDQEFFDLVYSASIYRFSSENQKMSNNELSKSIECLANNGIVCKYIFKILLFCLLEHLNSEEINDIPSGALTNMAKIIVKIDVYNDIAIQNYFLLIWKLCDNKIPQLSILEPLIAHNEIMARYILRNLSTEKLMPVLKGELHPW